MTDSCITKVKDKIIVFSEAKSKFILNNPNELEIEKHKVDGCLINDSTTKRCDFLAIDVLTGLEVYIELKGQDADGEAVEQIRNSVCLLSKNKSFKFGYIVHTSSKKPEIDTTMQRLIKQLKKSHNIILRFRKTPHTEIIENLLREYS